VARVRYRLGMPEPHTQLFHVEMVIEGVQGATELVMPSWTPGSYLLREFARNVRTFEARDARGGALAWTKTDKSTWRVEAPGSGEVHVGYTVFGHELSVRTSHLDASHAAVNGASVFLFVRGREREEIALEVVPPGPEWRISTALTPLGAGRFAAEDYDALIDGPLEIGTHDLLEWDVDGVPHAYAIWGRGNLDAERLRSDTTRIVRAARDLWGVLPYERYLFIVHLVPGGYGGLEHRSSTVLQVDRWAFRGKEYEQFLGLVAHEHFHVWNATRIRPEPLESYEYTRESYTRNLWVLEGLTTYYTDLLLRRAGLLTPQRYLERLGDAVQRLQALPGRAFQSLEAASFDAWIRFYRPDATTPNAQISYYQKGALVGLLLDMEIRSATGNRRSLDDVMRLLWERYGRRDAGFPEDAAAGMRALAEEVHGGSLREFFARYVAGTEELDFDRLLGAAGLRVVQVSTATATGGGQDEDPEGPRPQPTPRTVAEVEIGARWKEESGRTRLTHVLDGTPAHRAGLNAGDELVALDGLRVTGPALNARLAHHAPGERLALTVFRRDELLELPLVLDAEPSTRSRIVRIPDPTPAQDAVYRAWLGLDAPAA
jgi:predicted metalloprotease with PDZ domain